VQVHAIRTGGVVGEHEIRLISDNEEVSIVHRAFDRRVFAKGSLLGAVKLLSVGKSGLYSWDELFSDAFEGRLE
jgi:4-hydroxy-tetrahydrodipicolinate reductase